MRVEASPACTDAEFVRRASLDILGVLPSPDEVRTFLADPDLNRRVKLVDALLDRPEFADFWALKFADILRANGRLIETKGTLAFHRWIRSNLESNVPLDKFVRDLLTADGSSLQNPPASYYRISRDPESSVEATAQLFLGVRIQCAKCHNHPFERWTQDDYYGFAAFFARVKRKPGGLPGDEVIYTADGGEVKQPRTGVAMKPKALGGPTYDQPTNPADRRESLAAWLTGADNPFFAKSPGEPRLVPPDGGGAWSSRSTTSATRTPRQMTSCSTPSPPTSPGAASNSNRSSGPLRPVALTASQPSPKAPTALIQSTFLTPMPDSCPPRSSSTPSQPSPTRRAPSTTSLRGPEPSRSPTVGPRTPS